MASRQFPPEVGETQSLISFQATTRSEQRKGSSRIRHAGRLSCSLWPNMRLCIAESLGEALVRLSLRPRRQLRSRD